MNRRILSTPIVRHGPELIVDNFAGGGGASTGIALALNRCVDHAINHDRYALGMHRINHPQTIHHCEDVFDVDPETVCEGRRVGLCHNSPDCKHFSKAKGGKPLDKRIRGLVLVMLKWAKYGARVLTMENVEEIVTWGPLMRYRKNGQSEWHADKRHIGRTWQAFLSILSTGIDPDHPDLPDILEVLGGYLTKADCVRGLGYRYETRQLRACDLGTPTIRKRLYMVARNDGQPIVFPEDTHAPRHSPRLRGRRRLKPYRTIAECIDWHLPCPSIFLDGAAAKRWRCKRPLARATLRRIAKGVDRYVLRAKEPFIVSVTHQGGERIEPVSEPGRTVTGAHRGEKALVAPLVSRFQGDHAGKEDGATRNLSVTDPLRTQETSNRFAVCEAELVGFLTEHANASTQRNLPANEPGRTQCGEVKGGHFAVVAGTLVPTGYGERAGQEPRVIDPHGPGHTAVAGGSKQAAVVAHLLTNTTGHPGAPASKPARTIATGGHQALVTGTLVHTAHGEQCKKGKPRRGRGAHDLGESMPTATASPDLAVVSATIIGAGGRAGQSRPRGVDEGMHTITAKGDTCLAAASMLKLKGRTDSNPGTPDEPGHTVCVGGHHGLIAANLTKFTTGSLGRDLNEPAPTVTAGSHSPGTHGGAATTQGLVAAYLAQHNAGFNQTPGHPADKPSSTISGTGSQQQVVAASMAAYYGNDKDGQAVEEPARTVTTKDRLGLVESTGVHPMTPEQIVGAQRVAKFLRDHGVQFEGEFATVQGYVIVDLGMRMLTPRELFRAQGFGEGYVIDRAWVIDPATGSLEEIRLTKEQQIRMCGNSVCPPVMQAIIRSNCPDLIVRRKPKPPELSAATQRRAGEFLSAMVAKL